LGGNVLLKWLGEMADEAPAEIVAAAAVSVPFDLGRGSRYIDRGFSRVYQRYFIRSLVDKARRKAVTFPEIGDSDVFDRIRSLFDFDEAVTAPVHGFLSADDYYRRSSALHFLSSIRIPTLLLSAVDDPFLPREVLDEVRVIAERNPALQIEFLPHGGHVGFVGGVWPWRPDYYMERRVGTFFTRHLAPVVARRGAA
jgi:predicted alpha/beta-fold hydrolase